MGDTAFLRSDELPARTALGYLPVEGEWRTNVFHLPVRGAETGDYYDRRGYQRLLAALFAGRIVSTEWVAEMVRPRSDVPSKSMQYGLGFWLASIERHRRVEG